MPGMRATCACGRPAKRHGYHDKTRKICETCYQREYHHAHRTLINAYSSMRYRVDKAYRENRLRISKNSYSKHKKEQPA